MIGQYPQTEVWRWWIRPLGLMGFFTGLSWGISIRQRLGATLLVVGMPIILAFLPLRPASRGGTIGLLDLGRVFLGRRAIAADASSGDDGLLAFVPLAVVLVRGVGRMPASPL